MNLLFLLFILVGFLLLPLSLWSIYRLQPKQIIILVGFSYIYLISFSFILGAKWSLTSVLSSIRPYILNLDDIAHRLNNNEMHKEEYILDLHKEVNGLYSLSEYLYAEYSLYPAFKNKDKKNKEHYVHESIYLRESHKQKIIDYILKFEGINSASVVISEDFKSCSILINDLKDTKLLEDIEMYISKRLDEFKPINLKIINSSGSILLDRKLK